MLIGNQLPAHRRVEQDMHQGFEMGLALRCQIEFLQPIFDEQRFDTLESENPATLARYDFSASSGTSMRSSVAQEVLPLGTAA